MIEHNQTCCKCGQKGRFSLFETPDETGVIGMFTHKTGKKIEKKDFFGNTRYVDEEVRCFVKQDELDKTDWFKSWFEELKIIREKYWQEQRKKDEEEYQKHYAKMMEEDLYGEEDRTEGV